jgi:hypothetical protein
MRGAILKEIDDQRGLSYSGARARPYRWIRTLASYGVIFPDIESLWTAWWFVPTQGRAIASTQYLSCLIYHDDDNPVFAPWTADAGGGPPVLWEFAGHLNHRWCPENVAFLRRAVTPETVTAVLVEAAERLIGQPEHEVLARVLDDVSNRGEVLRHRCGELPRLFERRRDPGDLFSWSA